MNEPQPQAPLWNIANILTILRLLLVPVFVCLMLGDSLQWWALLVFVLAALTDKLDGTLARRLDLVTDFGKLADPIADKLLVLSAFVLLSVSGLLPWWVTLLVLIREIGITVLRQFMKKYTIMAANWSGKLKTVVQIILIVLLLIPWQSMVSESIWAGIQVFSLVFAVLVVIITWASAWGYLRNALLMYRQAAAGAAGAPPDAKTERE